MRKAFIGRVAPWLGAALLAVSVGGCKDLEHQRADDGSGVCEIEVPMAVGVDVPSADAPTRRLRMIDRPSANHDARRLPVSMIVLHYTAVIPAKKALAHLCSTRGHERVSAHYTVDVDGTVYRMVDESRRAWHAGVSYWKGIRDVNSASIGIEIVHPGPDRAGKLAPYSERQIDAVILLCRDIMRRHDIRHVVGHSDIAPRRKLDPGENFPWARLAAEGVGVWTDETVETDAAPMVLLAKLGYDTRDHFAAIQAFRRHWHPEGLDGHDFRATVGRMAAVLKRIEGKSPR